jgi:hypothetical protein
MKSLKMRYGFYLLTRGPIATRDGILSLAPNITLGGSGTIASRRQPRSLSGDASGVQRRLTRLGQQIADSGGNREQSGILAGKARDLQPER